MKKRKKTTTQEKAIFPKEERHPKGPNVDLVQEVLTNVTNIKEEDQGHLKEGRNGLGLGQEIEIEDALVAEIVDEDVAGQDQETDVGIDAAQDHVIGNTEAEAVIENQKSNVTMIKKRRASRTRKGLHLLLSKKRIQRPRIWIFQILRNFSYMYI